MKRPYREPTLALIVCLVVIPIAWAREFYVGILIAMVIAGYIWIRPGTSKISLTETNPAPPLEPASQFTLNSDDPFWMLNRNFLPLQYRWAHIFFACAILGYFSFESNVRLLISGAALGAGVFISLQVYANRMILRKGLLTAYRAWEEPVRVDLRSVRSYRLISNLPGKSDLLALYDANDTELIRLDMERFDLRRIWTWATRSLEPRPSLIV